jgi:hypothetical protein
MSGAIKLVGGDSEAKGALPFDREEHRAGQAHGAQHIREDVVQVGLAIMRKGLAIMGCTGAMNHSPARRTIMSNSKTYTGSCFCGAVGIKVEGSPEAMGYCHCQSCRHWSAGPVNAFTLWKPSAVSIERGAAELVAYRKTENSIRKWCRNCGGHVLTEHPGFGLTDVYAAMIPELAFQPGVHVNYAETVLRMKDGLPKLKDFPAELGGSGIAVAE